jgi:hypothetical protein
METLDENVNNKSKTFWENTLVDAFKSFWTHFKKVALYYES